MTTVQSIPQPTLVIVPIVAGPVQTNSYLIADSATGTAVVVDPAWEGEKIAVVARRNGWRIEQIWLTHAHFDHLGGVAGIVNYRMIVEKLATPLVIALHPADLPLWQTKGGAQLFGMWLDPGPEPSMLLVDGQKLNLGSYSFIVRHAPGHTPGHVIFYCPAVQVAFCGDVIFAGSIGRTDLPGGDYGTLMNSIHSQILSLPEQTRLLPGHGPETTVGVEKTDNPFLTNSSH